MVPIGGCFKGDFAGQYVARYPRTASMVHLESILWIVFIVNFLSKLEKKKEYTSGCLPEISKFEPNNDINKRRKMARVLVVDDEEAIRLTLHRFLTDAGHEVLLAENGNDARDILADKKFDVAVIDKILPDGKSGMDVIREIKRYQSSCEVILMSGFPLSNDSAEGNEDEPFIYLTKPVAGNEIVRSVEKAAKKASQKNIS